MKKFSIRSKRLESGFLLLLLTSVCLPLSATPIFTGNTVGSSNSSDANFVDVGANGAGYYIWSNADQTEWSVRWTGLDTTIWDGNVNLLDGLSGEVRAQGFEASNGQFGGIFGLPVVGGTIDGLAYDNGDNQVLELDILVARANPAPPVGPTLGAAGLNILLFSREFNERSTFFGAPTDFVPVTIGANADKSFNFVVKDAPTSPEYVTWQSRSDGDGDIDGFDFTLDSFDDPIEFDFRSTLFDNLSASIGQSVDSAGIFIGAGLTDLSSQISFDSASGLVQQSFAIATIDEPAVYTLFLAGLGGLLLRRKTTTTP